MRIRCEPLRPLLALGLGLGLAAHLAAEEGEPGFKWLGLRAGTLFFDPPENTGTALPLGVQGGMVFKGQRYGLTLDGFEYRSENALLPGVKLPHRGAGLTFLATLSDAPGGLSWPYMGLGLGTSSVPEIDPVTLAQTTTTASTAHASLGFLHRTGGALLWGVEGRFVFGFPLKNLQEVQASVLLGYTWGGRTPAPVATLSAQGPAPVAPRPAAQIATPATQAAPPAQKPVPGVKSSVLSSTTALPAPAPAPARDAVPRAQPAAPALAGPSPAREIAAAVPVASPLPQGPAPEPVGSPAPAATVPAPSLATAPKVPASVQPRSIPSDSTAAERAEALRRGEVPRALELSRRHLESLPGNRWILRLEVAARTSTLQTAAGAFPIANPDLFIAELQLRDGRTAYQLFLGDHASKAEALQAIKAVPAFFLQRGERPIPILVMDAPALACPMVKPVPVPAPTTTPAPKGIMVKPKPSCTRCH
jgi:hypothetical protein